MGGISGGIILEWVRKQAELEWPEEPEKSENASAYRSEALLRGRKVTQKEQDEEGAVEEQWGRVMSVAQRSPNQVE